MFYARNAESQESMDSLENQDTVHSAIHKDIMTHRELSSLLTVGRVGNSSHSYDVLDQNMSITLYL